jgi:sulfopyruvate decarboxylase TPP-binding subunit
MGAAAPSVLDVLKVARLDIATAADLKQLSASMQKTYEGSCVRAAFLQPELWS